MAVSDLNIISLGQKKKASCQTPHVGTDVLKTSRVACLYGDKWSVLSTFKGYLYYLYPVNNKGEYDYSHGFFSLKSENNKKHIILSDLNADELEKIIDFYIQQSPIKKICLLARLDWSKNNVIKGTLSKSSFMKDLKNGKILFNTLYIISS